MVQWCENLINPRQTGKRRIVSNFYYRKLISNMLLRDCFMNKLFNESLDETAMLFFIPFPRYDFSEMNKRYLSDIKISFKH